VAQALEEMGDLKGLSVDLRQNPGGCSTEGVGVPTKFLRKGQLIVFKRRSSPENAMCLAHGNGGREFRWSCWSSGTASARRSWRVP